ncbi:MAG: peptide-methionine (S)-S-oxide reductase MsrA [Anaerolineae bacterium]
MTTNFKAATFGAGCFWCVEAVFEQLRGVQSVMPGYAGGHVPNPTYRQVCTGSTGHAEVAQITFDPGVITFAELLDVFWQTHDPTTLNRQGADVGSQYRSVIFYHSAEQKTLAEASKAKLEAAGVWPRPIVTEIVPLGDFFPAEEYHQTYYRRNPTQPYCRMVIVPKLKKLNANFADRLKN